MGEKEFIDAIYKSMQDSARQVRRSLGRTSYATTREQALSQVEMLQQAKQTAQQTGKQMPSKKNCCNNGQKPSNFGSLMRSN